MESGLRQEAKLAKKVMYAQDRCYSRWLIVGSSSEPNPSFLNVEQCVGGRALLVNVLFAAKSLDIAAQAGA